MSTEKIHHRNPTMQPTIQIIEHEHEHARQQVGNNFTIHATCTTIKFIYLFKHNLATYTY